jgi:hypothetical protein
LPTIGKPKLRIFRTDIVFGSGIDFEVVLQSESISEQRLVLDYVIQFRKANGSLAPKVF